MEIKGFSISEGYDPINHLLIQNIKISEVKLRNGFLFIEYEPSTKREVLIKSDIIKTGLGKSIPQRLKDKLTISHVSNIKWDVEIDREQRITTFVVFWEEPIEI